MKLVKIEDVRVGQIWEHKIIKLKAPIILADDFSKDQELYSFDFLTDEDFLKLGGDTWEPSEIINEWKLIGFLGITHEIKDNMLVEIPREELQVDDVVMFKDGTQRQYVIIEEQKEHFRIFRNNKSYKCIHETYGDRLLYDFEIKKIGIYGVTHEFVNKRLAR